MPENFWQKEKFKLNMKKIRLLFTINNLGTAGMRFVLADIAKSLPNDKYEVAIGVNYLTNSALEEELNKKFEIHVLYLRTPRRPILLYPIKLLKSAFNIKGDFDLAHSFDYASDYSEGYIMKVAGIKWIVEKTNLIYSSEKWDKKLNLADRIICLSNAQRIQLPKFSNKVTVIPTGVDKKRYIEAISAKRESIGLNQNNIVCISVAHLIDVKGHLEMMQAMNELKEDFPHLVMLFVGKGEQEYETKLKSFADENQLQNNVKFLGERSDVPELIKMADFKLLATRNTGRREGFGAVVVEAMACSKAVISTKSGGPEDIVVEGVTGLLIEAEGYRPIVNGIKELLKSPDNLNIMGASGYQRYLKMYTKTIMVENYKKIYESFN